MSSQKAPVDPDNYIAKDAFPDTIKDAGIKELLMTYMHLSNSPNAAHPGDPDEKAFVELFTDTGTYEIGPQNAKGRDGRPLCSISVIRFVPSNNSFGSSNHQDERGSVCPHPNETPSDRQVLYVRLQ